jgi:hypothetical protein
LRFASARIWRSVLALPSVRKIFTTVFFVIWFLHRSRNLPQVLVVHDWALQQAGLVKTHEDNSLAFAHANRLSSSRPAVAFALRIVPPAPRGVPLVVLSERSV